LLENNRCTTARYKLYVGKLTEQQLGIGHCSGYAEMHLGIKMEDLFLYSINLLKPSGNFTYDRV
jgi:hypothetical protein